MKAHRGVTRAHYRAVRVATKRQGVLADFYRPVEPNNRQHGYKDSNIKYHTDPDQHRVLLPAFFRKGSHNLAIIDPFFEPEEIWLYLPEDTEYPNYTKVVTRTDEGFKNYVIEDRHAFKDGDTHIFSKYKLVPDLSINVTQNRDELKNSLENETDDADLRTNEDLVPKPIKDKSTKITIDPIA